MNRREFLKKAGIGTAALVIAPTLLVGKGNEISPVSKLPRIHHVVTKEKSCYVIRVRNILARDVYNVKVLGFNLNVGLDNYGNEKGIKLSFSNSIGTTYREFLYQSASKPFKVEASVFSSKNDPVYKMYVSVRYTDANGAMYTQPLHLCNSLDHRQITDKCVAVKKNIIIDGNTELIIDKISSGEYMEIRLYTDSQLAESYILKSGNVI